MRTLFKRFPGLFMLLLGICLFNFDYIHQSGTRTAYITIPRGRYALPIEPHESIITATINEFWGICIIAIGFAVWWGVDFFTLRKFLEKGKGNRIENRIRPNRNQSFKRKQ
jgi:hypothetical protein